MQFRMDQRKLLDLVGLLANRNIRVTESIQNDFHVQDSAEFGIMRFNHATRNNHSVENFAGFHADDQGGARVGPELPHKGSADRGCGGGPCACCGDGGNRQPLGEEAAAIQ